MLTSARDGCSISERRDTVEFLSTVNAHQSYFVGGGRGDRSSAAVQNCSCRTIKSRIPIAALLFGCNHRPPTQQACQQLAFGPDIIKPVAMIFLQQCVDGCVHRTGSPDFTRSLQGYRAVLVDRIPLVSDFQRMSCTIVSKALDTRILDGMMRSGSGSRRCSQSTVQCQQPAHHDDSGVQWSTSLGFESNWPVFTGKF